MVLGYVDYDLAGLMSNEKAVSSTSNSFFIILMFDCSPCSQYLTPAHVQSYMKQLLTGVHYMHKNNILHRDLKGDMYL